MAREFVGNNTTYITVAANAAMGLTHDFTVAGWVWLDDFGEANLSTILDAYETAGSNIGFAFRIQSPGGGLVFTTKSVKDYASATASISAGSWHHIAAVLDANDDCTFFVNGVQFDTITHTAPGVANTTVPWSIGMSTDAGFSGGDDPAKFYWDGKLAEIVVIPRALNASEVRALALGVNPIKFGPVLYAPLWGIQSPEIDLTPNHHTLTVTAATKANHPPVSQFTFYRNTFFFEAAGHPAMRRLGGVQGLRPVELGRQGVRVF